MSKIVQGHAALWGRVGWRAFARERRRKSLRVDPGSRRSPARDDGQPKTRVCTPSQWQILAKSEEEAGFSARHAENDGLLSVKDLRDTPLAGLGRADVDRVIAALPAILLRP
jgi:hypothetical protein